MRLFSRSWNHMRFYLLLLLIPTPFIAPHSVGAQVEVSHGHIDFQEVLVGLTASIHVWVRNVGDQAEELDIRLLEPHSGFWLTGTQGVVTLPPHQIFGLDVHFSPADSIPYETTLLIGEGLPEVPVTGAGRGPRVSYSVPPVTEFEQIPIGTTQIFDIVVSNFGEIPFEIHPQLSPQILYFSLESPLGPRVLLPFDHQYITFLYAPEEVQTFEVTLDLGAVVNPVLLRGSSREPQTSWNMTPSPFYMGKFQPGEIRIDDVQINNTGDLPISISSSFVGEHDGFEFQNQVAPFILEPMTYHREYIRFAPMEEDTFSAWFTFGDQYGAVELIGVCEIDYFPCGVSPTVLDFGNVGLGRTGHLMVEVSNLGDNDPIEIVPAIDSPHFSILASPRTLFPRTDVQYTVDYHPQTTGPHEAILVISTDICRDVSLVGLGGVNEDHCQVIPDTLNFGPLSLGRSITQLVSITNIGDTDLILSPSFDSPDYSFAGGDANLTPGSSTTYAITFEPVQPGTTTAMFDLGGVCRPIVCQGIAVSGFEPHQNQVGIYFDQDFTQSEVNTEQASQIVTGYLVFHHPSEESGVGAYELNAELTGAGIILQWDLEGDALNFGDGNELVVGVGGSPLLPDSNGNILLATLHVMVIDPFPSEVSLQLGPVSQPSLANLMAWIPWHDSTMLIPLLPATGLDTACWINPNPVSAIDIPAPLVLVDGELVILEWRIPAEFPEEGGFHVYRRVNVEEEARLTDHPLSGAGGLLSFTDSISAFPPSTVLSYSFALVENGAETLRSPVTEIRLSGVPAVRTRLMANVPNPFNASTEVQFELRKPGQTRVSVYDMNGRLIRDLVDERLRAGTHRRVWEGRDGAGRPVPSGAYYLRLVTPDAVDHHKIMLLK